MTLNKEKCLFNKPRLKFLGHIIDSSGISLDPDKSTAIKEFPPPCNVSDLRRFMGMVTQMGKFSPNIAQLSQPLRALLSSKQACCWEPKQQEAFTVVQGELTKPSTLAYYDPAAETKVSADASSRG